MKKWKMVYEDDSVIVVNKPAGMDSQESRGTLPDMVSELRRYLLPRNPGGMPYLGVIHRLDRQVGGLLVYAKTKEAAAALSRDVRERRVTKIYLAVVCGRPAEDRGEFRDMLWKDPRGNVSLIVEKQHPDAREAVLSYEVLGTREGLSLLRIRLGTGRHHQIRVQCAGHGIPLWGDVKYNREFAGRRGVLPALFAAELQFAHPKTGRLMAFRQEPEGEAFLPFAGLIARADDGGLS